MLELQSRACFTVYKQHCEIFPHWPHPMKISDKSHNSCQTPHKKMRSDGQMLCQGQGVRPWWCPSFCSCLGSGSKLLFFPILQLQPRKEEISFLDDGPLRHCCRLKSHFVLSFWALVQRRHLRADVTATSLLHFEINKLDKIQVLDVQTFRCEDRTAIGPFCFFQLEWTISHNTQWQSHMMLQWFSLVRFGCFVFSVDVSL